MLEDKLNKLLHKYGVKFTNALKRQLKIDRTYASGDTYKSIKYKVSNDNLEIQYSGILNIIDAGRKSGRKMPSSTDIILWMKARNVRPRGRDNRFLPTTQSNMRRAAFSIALGIGRKGTIKRFGYKGSGILDFINKNGDLRVSFERDLKLTIEDELDNLF